MSGNNKVEETSQYLDNMSFDKSLGVKIVEIIGQDGILKNPATEETLQVIAGMTYDTTSIDTSDPTSIVVSYKKNGSTIYTETINTSGNLIEIIKT